MDAASGPDTVPSCASCLSDDEAAGFVAGALGPDEHRAAADHLDGCDLCRRLVSALAVADRPPDDTAPAGVGALEPLAAGGRLGRFVLLRRLGQGAMGDVWAARDPELDRDVALKLLRVRPGGLDVQSTLRLRREAQAMARLHHPNVVAIYELGTDGDRVFCAMELIDGTTLRSWLDQPRTWRAVLAVARAAGTGIAAAHAAGLVHRDIKPENLLIARDGRCVVTDFGLARLVDLSAEPTVDPDRAPDEDPDEGSGGPPGDASGALTETGAVIGTPVYMAPEQLRGQRVDARSDQFSYCVTVYEALLGTRPFRGDSLVGLAQAIEHGVRELPRAPGVPAGVVRCLVRGLAVDPAARWPSVAALVDALDRAANRPRRRRIAAAAGALSIAVVTAAAVLVASSGRDAYAEETAAVTRRIAAVWSPARAQALTAAFARSGAPTAADNAAIVTRHLDGYRAAWQADRLDAWAATHLRNEQAPELLARRLTCFDELADTMDGLIALFTAAERRDVERAPQIVYRLPPVTNCRPERLAARSPAPSGPGGKQAGRALYELELLQIAGRYAEVAKRAEAAVADAGKLGDPVVLARARFMLGVTQANSGHAGDAEATLRLAVQDAAAARDHYLVAEAWLRLMMVTGVDLAHPDAARAMTPAVTAAVAQAGNDPRQQADLAMTLGSVAQTAGDHTIARDQFVIARDRRIAARGPEHPSVSGDESNLGVALADLGDYEQAIQHYERALAIARQALGERHPLVSQIEQNIADLANQRKDWAAAEHHAQVAIAINQVARSADDPTTALCRLILALSLRQQHRFDESRRELAAARASMARSLPPTHSRVLMLDTDEAELAELEGRWDDARALARRAVTALREHGGRPPHLQHALSVLATVVAHDAPGDALPIYDETLTLYTAQTERDPRADVDTLKEMAEAALRAHRPAPAIAWFDRLPAAAAELTSLREALDRMARTAPGR